MIKENKIARFFALSSFSRCFFAYSYSFKHHEYSSSHRKISIKKGLSPHASFDL